MTRVRNVIIRAIMVDNNIEFEMRENGVYTELLLFNKTKDNMPASEGYEIEFELRNGNGVNLQFVQDPDDVMYVSRGSSRHVPKCPQNGNGNPQTPFRVTGVWPERLTVENPDADECFYKFALRFEDQNNGGNIVPFDPIYGNQDGGN